MVIVSVVVVADTLVITLVRILSLVILLQVSQYSTQSFDSWGSYVLVLVLSMVVRSVVLSVVNIVT